MRECPTDGGEKHLPHTGLQQLTHTRGLATEADGTVTVELPGPFAYPEKFE